MNEIVIPLTIEQQEYTFTLYCFDSLRRLDLDEYIDKGAEYKKYIKAFKRVIRYSTTLAKRIELAKEYGVEQYFEECTREAL